MSHDDFFFVLYALYLVTLNHRILKATFGCKPNIFWYITVISVKNPEPNLTEIISMKKTNEITIEKSVDRCRETLHKNISMLKEKVRGY